MLKILLLLSFPLLAFANTDDYLNIGKINGALSPTKKNVRDCPTCPTQDSDSCKEKATVLVGPSKDTNDTAAWYVSGDRAYHLTCHTRGIFQGYNCRVAITDSNGKELKSENGEDYFFEHFPESASLALTKDGSLPLLSAEKNKLVIMDKNGEIAQGTELSPPARHLVMSSSHEPVVQTAMGISVYGSDASVKHTASTIDSDAALTSVLDTPNGFRYVTQKNKDYFISSDTDTIIQGQGELGIAPYFTKNAKIILQTSQAHTGTIAVYDADGNLLNTIQRGAYTDTGFLRDRLESMPLELASGDTVLSSRDGVIYSVSADGKGTKVASSMTVPTDSANKNIAPFRTDPLALGQDKAAFFADRKIYIMDAKKNIVVKADIPGPVITEPALLPDGNILVGVEKDVQSKYLILNRSGKIMNSFAIDNNPNNFIKPQVFRNGNILVVDQNGQSYFVSSTTTANCQRQ